MSTVDGGAADTVQTGDALATLDPVADWAQRPTVALSSAQRRRLFAQHLADRRVPESLCVNLDGRVAFTVRSSEAGQSTLSVWTTDAAAAPRRLGSLDAEVMGAPSWSADGSVLAMAVGVESEEGSRIIFVDGVTGAADDADTATSIAARVETIMWTDPDTVLALCAEPGSDSVVTSGAVRYTAASKRQRPRVTRPGSGRRQLYQWSRSRRPRAVGPRLGSVWDAAMCGADPVVVWSADPSESGWYDSVVAVLDRESGELRPVYTPHWQVSPLATTPDHRRVAFVEGWSSDRGKVCGDIRVVDVDTAEVIDVATFGVDVVQVAWRSSTSVWFAGWSGMSATWGWVGLDGVVGLRRSDDLKPGTFGFPEHERAEVWAVSDPRDGSAPDVAVVAVSADPLAPVRTVTRLSRGTLTQFGRLTTHPVSWSAADGPRVDGVLVVPHGATSAPLVVYAHGGPANLWSSSLSPETRYLVDAGFAVLLANPRGSVGRGQEFARANLGDPAGGELADLVAGINACAVDGVDTGRVAILGGSYGGYLAACGAAMTDRFACAVVMFGHPDLLSARYGSNNPAFYDKLLLGDPSSGNAAAYVDRSAIVHVSPQSAPTLLIHGGEDRCCPVGQAEEMYRALAERQVDTELVIYPEEGHGLHGIEARTDCWARTVAWLNRHLDGHPR